MIKGFEHITGPLSQDEKDLAILIVSNFKKNYVGKEKAISGKVIVQRMQKNGFEISEPRLRKIMNYIRQNSLAPILANSRGYWYSNNYFEIKEQVKSLRDRSKAIESAAEGLINYTRNNFHQQLSF